MIFRVLVAFLLVAPAPALAAWSQARTRHFIVYSEQKPDELRAYAAKAERYDSAVRAVRKMVDPPQSDSNLLTVYMLRDGSDIEALSGPGVRGFYVGRVGGAVMFTSTQKGATSWDLDAETTFFHEYLHHMMLQDSSIAYPAWMREGYAEFFATAKFGDDGSVAFGAAANHRGYELRVLDDLTISEMLSGTTDRMSGEEFISIYSRGWLLTHYLAFEPSRRGQVTRYLGPSRRACPRSMRPKQPSGTSSNSTGSSISIVTANRFHSKPFPLRSFRSGRSRSGPSRPRRSRS